MGISAAQNASINKTTTTVKMTTKAPERPTPVNTVGSAPPPNAASQAATVAPTVTAPGPILSLVDKVYTAANGEKDGSNDVAGAAKAGVITGVLIVGVLGLAWWMWKGSK